MKAALICDMHLGVRNDNQSILDGMERFYEKCFFPEIEKHEITTVFDLGDTFDRRKFMNYKTLDRSKEMWFDKLHKKNIRLNVITGNHTTYYKNTNKVNSVKLLLQEYDNINVIWKEPKNVKLGDTNILMVPWINAENHAASMKALKNTKATVVFGHFDIQGFQFNSGKIVEAGFAQDIFSKFEMVCSGHYHSKQTIDNMFYLGAPYEMNWGDFNQPRGFHILDTETRKLEFIRNPYRLFYKVFYNDKDKTMDEVLDIDLSHCQGCYVKVVISNKDNPHLFDMFMDKLYKEDPANINVVEDHLNFDMENDDSLIDQTEDTLTIMQNYVGNMKMGVNQNKIEALLTDLYQEALTLDLE